MRVRLLTLGLIVCTAAFAGDHEFDRMVRAIESHYNTHPTHIPFMGVANLFVKVAHPEGVSGFRIAVFDRLSASSDDRFLSVAPDANMRPLVEVHSRTNYESTYIYAGEIGKSTKLLIATFEREQATVIEVKVSIETLLKALQNPDHLTETLGIANDDN